MLTLYLDESGAADPKAPSPKAHFAERFFSIGGFVCRRDDQPLIEERLKDFQAFWQFKDPLHSTDIRNRKSKFWWLAKLSADEQRWFREDLHALLCGLPIVVHACVIDRKGYHTRYHELHGDAIWELRKTAATIVIERAAKYAISQNDRLEVVFERSGKDADARVIDCYRTLRDKGAPFAQSTSSKYNPLEADTCKATFAGIQHGTKENAGLQIADMVLYPAVIGGSDRDYPLYRELHRAGKLIDNILPVEDVPTSGIKYFCFSPSTVA